MMKADIFDGIIDTVWSKILDGVATFSDYAFVGELWVGVAALVIATGVVAIYVPWQWVRSALGLVALSAGLFAAGAQTMFNRMRREKSEHDKRQEFDKEVKKSNDKTDRWF